jgi:choice-of-anchor C domain-containing protein
MKKQGLILCVISVVVLQAVNAFAGLQLVANGSFENGRNDFSPGTYGIITLSGGDTSSILNWTVGGSIDYIKTRWIPADGERSLDLNGLNAGSVSQTLTTVIGQQYEVRFWMSANPENDPEVKEMRVYANNLFQDFSFTTGGFSNQNMLWIEKTWNFIASNNSTTLTFQSLIGGRFGPALDNVSVTAIPEPGTLLLACVGTGTMGWLRNRRISKTI